jgi:hypothetical protein
MLWNCNDVFGAVSFTLSGVWELLILFWQDIQSGPHDPSLYGLSCRAEGRKAGHSAQVRGCLVVSLALLDLAPNAYAFHCAGLSHWLRCRPLVIT